MKKRSIKLQAMRLLTFALCLMTPTLTFAQDATSPVQMALQQYGKPLFYGAAILVCFVGAAVNMEKIIDKEGTGTRQQGIQNLAVIVLFVLVAVAAINFVANQLQSVAV